MKHFYEKSVRAVITRAIRHYAEARDKYIYDYDEQKSIYTLNLDSDNIYFQKIEKMIFIEEDLTNIG